MGDFSTAISTALTLIAHNDTGANVRFGSKADIALPAIDVRSSPQSGHWRATVGCPLCAKSGYTSLQPV
jgi:hypothetical protein